MKLKVGIDVGGTFTDFFVTGHSAGPMVHKVPSTPSDPSAAVVQGLTEIASAMDMLVAEFARAIETIVHGTTVTTNAVLTRTGAKTGLLTTAGVRDALEMRRGVREEQYNNRYTNVRPLVPRYLRLGARGRLNYRGETIEPLNQEDVREAARVFTCNGIEAVAICFMNSFANPEQERAAAELVREAMPDVHLTVSCELLPAIRFYNRVSTSVLSAYVGPRLSGYLDRLISQLSELGFTGTLLVMQSNGGVVSPAVARARPALTLLSGPAAGPGAGMYYARQHGCDDCITVDMGGTSFDAALVRNGTPEVVTEGQIGRHRIALPMLDIVTIGAGGGSIGWIDEGGLLRMGPRSAGADPGPACYGAGGTLPTCTDADLVLGYLDAVSFAGGRMRLDQDAAVSAIKRHVADPLRLTIDEAAAGMYRLINTNMAHGVREVSVRRGLDPREFPLIVAGGAGPVHACMICRELDIPMFLVPRHSSIFCAAGMLMCDLCHDFVHSVVSPFHRIDWMDLANQIERMIQQGAETLAQESIAEDRRRFSLTFDCRYVRQYHEVSFPVRLESVRSADSTAIAAAFHSEHRKLYGYSLENEGTPIELISLRLCAIGVTVKPSLSGVPRADSNADTALIGRRSIYDSEDHERKTVPVYNGHAVCYGHRISGPALIEQRTTTLLLSDGFDCVCDRFGTFVVYRREQRSRLAPDLLEAAR